MHDEEASLAPDSCAAARELRYPGGFDAFFRAEYRSLVKALILMEGADLLDADDCVASAMEKILSRWNLPESDPNYVRHPRAYVLTVAKDHFRKCQRRSRTVPFNNVDALSTTEEPALTAVDGRQFVAHLLKCLSPAQSQVIHLISEGYSQVEIANILGKKSNNIRQIARQARERLLPLLRPPVSGSPEGEEEES